jgi:hypothetical protein
MPGSLQNRCSPDLVPTPIAPFDRAPTPAEFEAIARANAAFVQSCFEATGELVGHLSSIETAADIERIRFVRLAITVLPVGVSRTLLSPLAQGIW